MKKKDCVEKKYFTFMIVPHDHAAMKQIKIPIRLIYGGAIGLGVALLGIFLLMYGWVSMSLRTADYERLLKDTGLQKRRIIEINNRLSRLNNEMDNLNVFSKRLQILMGLDTNTEMQKIGGYEENEMDRFSVLYKKNQKELLDSISVDLNQLERDIPYQQSIHATFNEIFEKNTALLASIPSVSPVAGGWISSSFGVRNDPFTGRRKMHYGIDLAQNRNAPVYATADGKVIYAKRSGGLGKLVEIDHGFGFVTRYGHLSVILVKFNQQVKRGDLIGRVGSTGRSTGLHLHYEVRIEGIPVEPKSFLLDRFKG